MFERRIPSAHSHLAKDVAADVRARQAAAIRSVIETTTRQRFSDANRARLLFGVRSLLARRRRTRRRIFAGALSGALVASFFVLASRDRWSHPPSPPQLAWSKLDIAGVGQLRFSAGASYSFVTENCRDTNVVPDSGRAAILLESGELCASIDHREPAQRAPFEMCTERLKIRDLGTMFCATAEADVSSVKVTEGSVWVESKESGRGWQLGAGDSVRSDQQELWTRPGLTLAPIELPHLPARRAAAVPSDCSRLRTLARRRACYQNASAGGSFGAQNALYSLALLDADQHESRDRALAELRLYQSRFPQGHLGPEVSLALIRLLAAETPDNRLLEETGRFLSAYPEHPKFYEVALVRADSLFRLGRRADAHRGYGALLDGHAPAEMESTARRGFAATAPFQHLP